MAERAVESGEVPSAELVDRFMREYQRELEEFLVAYCNEPALREEVRLGIIRGVFQRLRETHGEAASQGLARRVSPTVARAKEAARRGAWKPRYAKALAAIEPELSAIDRQIEALGQLRANLVEERLEALLGEATC